MHRPHIYMHYSKKGHGLTACSLMAEFDGLEGSFSMLPYNPPTEELRVLLWVDISMVCVSSSPPPPLDAVPSLFLLCDLSLS